MKHYLIPTRPIEDGLDRQNLSILRKRFLAVNSDRLERMHQALAPRHRQFLDALPIMFHCNHPMMPGFVARRTPCKVSEFKPEKQDIEYGRAIARSFTVNYEPDIEEEIYGIYVMGSVGTVAQSDRSDLDIWLCHKPGIAYERLQELQKKCELISQWAEQQRLEAHFFLMDYEAFKRGELSQLNTESSGSAQRLLLLDEFYRSAIFIAGRTPLWWFVPQDKESDYENYTSTLVGKRFLPPKQVLDFGGMAKIPGGEFIGAGIWQLYKAIESPYKSVLKLLLLEAYVSDFPDITPLSLTYKQLIYQGEMDIDKLDSYAMIYSRIEEYLLERGQTKRLELARRCFYFKVHRRLTRSSNSSHRPWQREILKRFVDNWGWDDAELQRLDNRAQWKAAEVTKERAQLVHELNHSYQILLEFAQRDLTERSISSEELTVLGRKLQAAFERRPGKIEWINPNISEDLSEDALLVEHYLDETQKEMWRCAPANAPKRSLKVCNNPSELLLWAYFNGIIGLQTPLELPIRLPTAEARRLLNVFEQWLPHMRQSKAHENFLQSARPTHVMLLINVGTSPSPELSQHGLQRLSNNTDALRYGGHSENLIASVDIISRNSWQEIHSRHFEGESALLNVLEEYLQLCLPGTHQAPPELRIECIGSDHASTIAHRVREWFSEISQCFYGRNSGRTRYLFQMSAKYFCLQFQGLRPKLTSYTSDEALLDSLASEQSSFSPIMIDSRALRDTALPLIASKMRGNTVNVFFRRFDIGMELYITDEKGSLLYEKFRGLMNYNPLIPLHRFIRSAVNRQARMYPEVVADFGILPIYFYELLARPNEALHAQQKQVPQQSQSNLIFDVKAIAHVNQSRRITYDFVCDDQEFSTETFGEQLFLVVAQFVLSRRAADESYPIYLTDLDLSLCEKEIGKGKPLQLVHYIRIKNFLEFKLNQAIGILLRA